MAIVNNVPSPPDMDSSKYEPDLNKPKKPMPKPKPKPKPKKAELFDVEEEVAIEEGAVVEEFVSNELDDEWNEQHLHINSLFEHFEHIISLTSVMPLILAS